MNRRLIQRGRAARLVAACLGAALAVAVAAAWAGSAAADRPARRGAQPAKKKPAKKKPAKRKPAGAPKAARRAPVRELAGGARLDWSRGLLVARGAAAGDLRAPSPNVARLGAERDARDAARRRLRALADDLPVAGGRTVGQVVKGDAAAAARLQRAVAASIDLAIDHATDGSVVLTEALPLEAVRAALYGPSPVPAGAAKDAPTALVIDATELKVTPALHLAVAAGAERYQGPTLFTARRPGEDDPRLGARPAALRAARAGGTSLDLAGEAAATTLAAARDAGALVVVVVADP